ncbi:MAG: hypothetical protein RL380_731 [Verrucomicrobiota bacterium]|jgi:hypothetical protein
MNFRFTIYDLRFLPCALFATGLAALFTGCTTTHHAPRASSFDFARDTFAYANGLNWIYTNTSDGAWTTARRDPPPAYSLHCYVMARAARQFATHARFEPHYPANPARLPQLIRAVVHARASEEIAIPGYANLREFSAANETLLQENCGGAWHCYFQRGNWRLTFPFTRAGQAREARRLADEIAAGELPIVHLCRFPQLTINHAVLLYAATTNASGLQFLAYDPNQPRAPQPLQFDAASKTFLLPRTDYFPGGRVDAYEIYRDWRY